MPVFGCRLNLILLKYYLGSNASSKKSHARLVARHGIEINVKELIGKGIIVDYLKLIFYKAFNYLVT